MEEELRSWDSNFVKVDQETMFGLILDFKFLPMASPSDEGKKKITLTSSDGVEFVVDEAVAMLSPTIQDVIEDGSNVVIRLQNVNSEILAKVIEYCKKHAETSACEEESMEDEFWRLHVKVDKKTLFDLRVAANYLGIKGLQRFTQRKYDAMLTENIQIFLI